ncbi:hypothetical protein HID58_004736 [Brassica napus]|uniref:Fatty acyl-CoA reductase n=1 Tax=Brassica napus TaxID=3708 RepID=A0ABQ8E6L9_BRANA|nr:hypothetical protein HID58_004736 [Brassica napus]
MESNCVQFLGNKTILITGAPGFLAKVLVEKILRLQPNVKKMYLLLRAADTKAAMQRLRSEVVEINLFKVLRNDLGEENLNDLVREKIVPVPGDISIHNLGVKDSDLLQRMWSEIDIVINIAATTNFDERYDIGLGINTFGALNVLNFAKKCVKGQLLLHVSTAYVCGENSGLAKVHGWPNTYVFTKAMGEMLVGKYRENLPLVIVRPTMITSTLAEPFPGWIEGLRTIDSVIVAYGKGRLKCFLADPNTVFDLIPADMVVNAMIATATAHSGETGIQTIYHVGSSFQNPVTFGQLHETAARYFTKKPLVARNGSPIIVTKGTLLSTMGQFSLYITLRYKLPLLILRLMNIIYPWSQGDKYNDDSRKIKLAMRLVDLYQPYLLFKGIFDDLNTESLRRRRQSIKELDGSFEFDPKSINWDDYMENTHIPGLITHVLKQ